ncbi:MAG TPA: hypothetical protein VLD85_08365 [Anaeromyxobacteraceae bacterium]|nr:hypothetical protein [Anaeromyxobacteraceae bacterium]
MRTPGHIDEATVRRLLSGEIAGEEARRVAEHLAEPCERCEELLSARADPLDGSLDAALLALSPRTGEPGNDVEWARIQRRLRPARRAAWRPASLAAAAAVAVALAVGIGLEARRRSEEASGDGLKGREVERVSARLRFSVSLPGPAGPALERAASGAVVPPEASLLFRVEASAPAQLALLRAGPEGSEVIWRGSSSGPGAVDVEIDGRPAAYPLRGLAGRQRFALLAAPSLDAEALQAARRALSGSAAAGAPGPAISLDVVEVLVR